MVGKPSESNFDDDSDKSDVDEFGDYNVGRIMVIHSSQTVNEPFFPCQVLKTHTHDEHFSSDKCHHIPADNYYMVCNYLGKTFKNF